MAPIRAAMARHWPAAECIDLLDQSLSIDRAKVPDLTPALTRRIADLAHHAARFGADGVLFTCAAFGPAIDAVATASDRPVLKPNQAMFEAALARGTRIAMLYTFQAACRGLETEFGDEIARQGSNGRLETFFVGGALDALQSGDTATHDRLIADAASRCEGFDAVMLAQFSMSRAVETAQAVCPAPVLSSPEAAVAMMQRCLGWQEQGPC